jgi:hypothetical protein
MNLLTLCFKNVLLLSLLLLGVSSSALPAADAIELRGYGKVSADLLPGRSVFKCESVAKADILLDKLQGDLCWDPTLPITKTDLKVGAATVTLYSLEGYGAEVIARSGTSVVVIGGTDAAQVSAVATGEPLLLGGDVTSRAAKPHPFSLDYFDNKAFKAYVQPMKSGLGFGVESHWPFMKEIGACEAFFGPDLHNQSPAPEVINWAPQDFEVRGAEQQKDMIVVGPDGGGELPLWVANLYPGSMMQGSDTTLMGDWGGAAMVGAHYESWSAPMEERAQTSLGFLQRAMERYGTSPSVGGWMLFAGSPGVEYNFHGRATHSWDTSVAGQEGWRRWLKEEKRLSLADLGTRWYDDPKHYSTWAEVHVPDVNEFYGSLGDDSFRLDSGWKWQNTPPPPGAPSGPNKPGSIPAPPAVDAPGWVPVASPPSQQQAFTARSGFNYYDLTVDPSDWLKKQKEGADVWLVFGMIGTGNKGAQVWLNNTALDLPTDAESRNVSFAVRVTSGLKPGPNHFQVALDCSNYQLCAGKMAGPVFLTIHEPKRVPYLGRGANARYVDFVDWQCWAMSRYHEQMIAFARKLDPDRPFVLSGGADPLFNYTVHLAADYGMGVENTGREASYRPHLPGEGLAAGFYSTSEWSNTPKGTYLDRGFGWILFDGDCSHCLFYNIEPFQQREKEDGWFTKHHRQIQLFGKYLREQPKIALLQSAESSRLNAPYGADIGLGEIEAAHYDNVYVTEDGLKQGLADRYPVLFDTGSLFMEADTVAAIRKYVEQGGTFIALNNTARHTALDPDSYPLSDLAGFKVTGTGKSGMIHFESQLPILKGWENKDFQGWGMAVDWLNDDHAKVSNLGLVPNDQSAIPLARWADGSVAVGYRKVGKGQIITLGSTFWRDGKDTQGVWRSSRELEAQFLERLFTDCGVTRTANATVPEVWARKMVTKNGLQNWLMAFNSTETAKDADVWMSTDGKPDEVIDEVTNAKVPFEFENNGVTIKALHFDPYEVKTFAVRRGTLADGLPVWWGEKTTYWKRTPQEITAANVTLPEPSKKIGENVIPLDQWRFHTDQDNALTTKGDWMTAKFDDSAWKLTEAGAWNYFDAALKDYHGTGLYRIKFTVPDSWTGRRVLLNLYDFDTPIVYDNGDFSINGTHVATYKARGWNQTLNFDVTAQVHPGENILTLVAAGGPKLGGLSGAVWIEARAPLKPSQDLSGPWEAVHGDWLTRTGVILPGMATAKYLTRDIQIPSDWKGKSVFVEWSTPGQWVGSLVINGHPISNNAAGHPFGLLARVNVSLYLKPGEKNTIEFWPYNTLTHGQGADKLEEKGIRFDSISIGCQ